MAIALTPARVDGPLPARPLPGGLCATRRLSPAATNAAHALPCPRQTHTHTHTHAQVKLTQYAYLIPPHLRESKPSYFIVGGLVFTSCSGE